MRSLVQHYASYNYRVTEQMVDWLSTQPESILLQDMDSSYRSLIATIGHIIRAQQYWCDFVQGTERPDFTWDPPTGSSQAVFQEWLSSADELRSIVRRFSVELLEEVLHLSTPWAQNDLPRYEYILHVIGHGTYHRGQIVTMARMAGVTEGIPNTDYNLFRSR